MESWNTGPIHMWLNRSGVERLAFPFQLTICFSNFKSSLVLWTVWLISRISITQYLRSSTRASAIVRRIMSSGPFQEWSPQYFFCLHCNKRSFHFVVGGQDVRDGASSAGESKHHKERVHNSSMCSSFLGHFVAHPAWLSICESPSCKDSISLHSPSIWAWTGG